MLVSTKGDNMTIRDWMERHGFNSKDLEDELKKVYPNAPSRQLLCHIVKGSTHPDIEVAIMLQEITDNEVSLEDMLIKDKCKYLLREETAGEEAPKEVEVIDVDDLFEML